MSLPMAQISFSESFLRGQRDGQLLAEDTPGKMEAEIHREAELQLRLLSSMGVHVQVPHEYIQGLLTGYQALESNKGE